MTLGSNRRTVLSRGRTSHNVDDTVSPDTALEIEGGNNVQSVAQLDANRVTIDFTDDVTPGQEWQLSAQPNWLLTPVDPVGEDGFVAA